jgi:hypothetical protein
MPRMVGWTQRPAYGGRRVGASVSLYPSPILGRRRPTANAFRPMGRIPRRRRRR